MNLPSSSFYPDSTDSSSSHRFPMAASLLAATQSAPLTAAAASDGPKESSSLPDAILTSSKLSSSVDKSHHGSTSTTFSFGSNVSSNCYGGISAERFIGDQLSVTTSGVVSGSGGTLSGTSVDHLPTLLHMTTDDSTPTISTLTHASGPSVTTSCLSLNSPPHSQPDPAGIIYAKFEDSQCSTVSSTHFSVSCAARPSIEVDPRSSLGFCGGGAKKLTVSSTDSSANEDGAMVASKVSPRSSNPSSALVSGSQRFNCASTCSQIICTPLRTIVSQNRRRYQMDGFNLDLTYITDRIIAMGYPADTTEALYRNSMSHIVKFLEHYHPGHYKVFNLRGRYVYDTSKFHNRVVSFEMTDHHPPRLELMAPFCREVHEYLEADPLNVVAVHCKAGKGRTGVMICAYLCYIAFYKTPRQNMDYYSIIRTHNNKGVTIPSQRRYVYYFSHLRSRQLNYMPLRCELVGIYLEKPPNLSGPFLKGALNVRVASGDVDVFVGDDLWLSSEMSEAEEEMHKRYPMMAGDDQYDPYNPQPGNECISRRCYGWTVPPNKRVFLQGDIRVDIFQKSRLKLLNVRQERKKIGHIWFNTMFTCAGFCDGQYVHGDEANPYPDATIVRRSLRRKIKAEAQSQPGLLSTNTVDANPQSPEFLLPSPNREFPVPTENGGSEGSIGTPQQPNRRSSKGLGMRLNGFTKKRSARSPIGRLESDSEKGWQSQDGELGLNRTKSGEKKRDKCRASLDNHAEEYEEEIIVDKPSGLDAHCPLESLKGIYQNEKQAPRYGIEEMIKEAYRKNLVQDQYNDRRASQPREGFVIPKSPMGRPNADGPYCLMREKEEHVSAFGVQEIDRAHKSKDLDTGFKVYIVTRCINEASQADHRLADAFLRVTQQKQTKKDEARMEKMELRHKKRMVNNQQDGGGGGVFTTTLLDSSQEGGALLDAAATQDPIAAAGGGIDNPCIAGSITTTATDSSSSSSQFSASIPDLHSFRDDPRLSDPHLRKYFFRQRITSRSKHPNFHYHCPNLPQDPAVCSKYSCGNVTRRRPQNSSMSSAENPAPSILYADNEEADVEDADSTTELSLDDHDFFRPRSVIRHHSRDRLINNCTGESVSSQTPPVDADFLCLGHPRSATLTSKNVNINDSGASSSVSDGIRSRSAIDSLDIHLQKERPSADSASSLAADPNEPENYHPSDCSWILSSSSEDSSSNSLSDQQQLAPQKQQ